MTYFENKYSLTREKQKRNFKMWRGSPNRFALMSTFKTCN